MSEEIKDIAEEVIVEETKEVVVEETTIEAPLTEARTISAIKASLLEMNKDELDAIFEAAEKAKAKKAEGVHDGDDEEDEEGDDEEGDVKEDQKEPKGKKLGKKKVKADDGSEGDVVEKEKGFKEDIDALAKGEDSLSEGFKAKAATIFEAALHSKVATKTAELEERYASDLTEEVAAIKEDLVDKVDGYLNYVVENWMTDNEVAIEHGLKSEITESFINSLGKVFKEHYINVPEDKGELIDQLSEDAKDAKAQLNTATEANIELSEKVKAFERKEVIAEACEGLAATEAAKLTELSEAIDASDLEEYKAKVATIKESYLNKDDTEVKSSNDIDAITEDKEDTQVLSGNMSAYMNAIIKTK
jgi:hypothetical protein